MRVGVVIVAGGRGARVGADRPKQLHTIGGRSMLRRSVDAFDDHDGIDERVVVLPADLIEGAAELLPDLASKWTYVVGGARRQDSVAAGLQGLSAQVDVVLVHDAARPFVLRELIDRVIAEAAKSGAAVPAMQATETVKQVDLETMTVRASVPRQDVWMAQTPQGFRRDVLAASFEKNRASGDADVTDEGMLAERAGFPVTIVSGDARNMKITTAEDLARVNAPAAARVGTGYDLHRLVDGRPLVLAGLTLASDKGPLGHSDGDVLCHSLTDALLGAAGAGDIGRHFPNTDPAWKNAAGLDLLARAVAIVRAAGFTPSSADITVILEAPKLAPHIETMRTHVARVLGVSTDAVSVKGKTNEGVDAVGRGEAIAAHAVAVLVAAGGRS